MNMKVMLNDVIEALDFVNDEAQYFYCIKAEEILMVWDGMVNGENDSDLIDEIEENFDEFIALPGKYEIDEYMMMEEFIDNLPKGRKQDQLYNAIRGKGAFRRFKDKVYEIGLEQKWYQYRDDANKKLAIKWCKENGIEIIK